MKRFKISTIFSVWALIILIVAGCTVMRAASYFQRGIAYGKKGQYDQAISDFTKAIELYPTVAAAYYNRGVAYGNRGQYDKAISDYTKAIEIDPRYAKAYYNRGLTYGKKGEYDKAIADYTKAIKIDPGYAVAYNDLAWLLATCQDAEYRDGVKAVELAQKAVELNPKAWYLDTLAAAYAEAGKFEGAIATQEKAVSPPVNTWKCEKCGAEISAEFLDCPNCGEPRR